MNLQKISDSLHLKPLTVGPDLKQFEVQSGYCSDLLSCVMTGAGQGGVWVTLMAHGNIVAVASLLDLSAIIITENAQPEPETVKKAEEQNIPILSTPMTNFEVVGRSWELGLRQHQE